MLHLSRVTSKCQQLSFVRLIQKELIIFKMGPRKRKSTSATEGSAEKKKAVGALGKGAKQGSLKTWLTPQAKSGGSEESAKESTSASDSSATGGLFSQLTEKSWKTRLAAELRKDYMKKIETTLDKEYKDKQIFPPKNLIFNAFNLTAFDDVKVVILGQDPYHDDGQAMGLSFSVPKGIKAPPSLRNIYKELGTDIAGFKAPDHGCLDKWATQGVLLLNATLTVEAHKANSHAKYGWQTFTDHVIRVLGSQREKIVFILWGGFAHKKEKLISASKHCVLKTAHPSPLSCTKFYGCKCFSKANGALEKFGKTSIDWSL